MTTLFRWIKFNLVGVLGIGVQLSVLTLLNRLWAGHYMWTSAIALEVTLLHNFLWHQRFTWRDRRELSPWPGQMLRFHLSNGLISLAGNLALMRVLVHAAHLQVIMANTVAILCCSILNFYVGNRWAFATAAHLVRPTKSKTRHSERSEAQLHRA